MSRHGRLSPRTQDGRRHPQRRLFAKLAKQRYAPWDSGIGAKIESDKADSTELEAYMRKQGEAMPNESGRQEFLENLINEFI